MIEKLGELNVPIYLQLWILDFLTDRTQYVRTMLEISPPIAISTGAPQGCVLSPILFVIYTNNMISNYDDCMIFKYADDTVILGLVRNSSEVNYRLLIDNVSRWCSDNFLNLNVKKTKEVIFDFCRKKDDLVNVKINGNDVEIVSSYKYLGVVIDNRLLSNMSLKKYKRQIGVSTMLEFWVNFMLNLTLLHFSTIVLYVLC